MGRDNSKWPNQNVGKKRCPHGHWYRGKNLVVKYNSRTKKTARQCRTCNNARQRRTSSERLYGVSLEEKRLLLKQQQHKCAICRKRLRRLFIDHCHKTNKVRGLLCLHCNSAMGFLKDDRFIILMALAYIEKHQ